MGTICTGMGAICEGVESMCGGEGMMCGGIPGIARRPLICERTLLPPSDRSFVGAGVGGASR